jgi:hypothetical protein
MTKIYCAVDGSYGSADGMSIFDTSGWTDEDWAAVEIASDDERLAVAREVQSRVFNEALGQDSLFDVGFQK